MSDVILKICGLQSVEVLKSMINLPIDYLGFVFAKSKRQVTSSQAVELLSVLSEWTSSHNLESVGVFVNPTIEELQSLLAEVPLDVLQLHGSESPEFCREASELFGLKIYKAFSVRDDESIHVEEILERYNGVLDGMLLDTYDPHYGGGSGVTFRWNLAAPYQTWAKNQGIPFLVAGGLHAGNVGELINTLAPDGVDVSSGVESDGVKDITKITAFVERVKGI
ncbi:phosphoribosylanthranilate isomerase [Paenibacillus anaericanus]|uniref:phosphoribosylanthranilate isomerase n=1 Tax=Paenibacillus anaericanus TaxID=170367 RepID=UPI0027899C83|nr:phosphoribosylanthranilate isomerase [Paenibacillus anaericanus]MDQ0088107.1 phosphoribosylanthranilate isomerase [Paenibacillus anaericanus]